MNGIRYMAKCFKTKEEAEEFKKVNGGVIYSKELGGWSRHMHYEAAIWNNFDPDLYPYSVSWTEPITTSNTSLQYFCD